MLKGFKASYVGLLSDNESYNSNKSTELRAVSNIFGKESTLPDKKYFRICTIGPLKALIWRAEYFMQGIIQLSVEWCGAHEM